MAFSGNALCNSFKQELLEGVHNFTTSGNTFKFAMYTNSQAGSELGGTSSTMDATVTAYSGSASNEVSSSGYSAGGGTLVNVAPSLKSTSTATTQFNPFTFSGVTLTARGALIYNSTNSNKAVCVLDFGTDKSASSGAFTINFPTNDASNALIRIA
jgi:hypothetical protein